MQRRSPEARACPPEQPPRQPVTRMRVDVPGLEVEALRTPELARSEALASATVTVPRSPSDGGVGSCDRAAPAGNAARSRRGTVGAHSRRATCRRARAEYMLPTFVWWSTSPNDETAMIEYSPSRRANRSSSDSSRPPPYPPFSRIPIAAVSDSAWPTPRLMVGADLLMVGDDPVVEHHPIADDHRLVVLDRGGEAMGLEATVAEHAHRRCSSSASSSVRACRGRQGAEREIGLDH